MDVVPFCFPLSTAALKVFQKAHGIIVIHKKAWKQSVFVTWSWPKSPAYTIILGAAFLLFWESDPTETGRSLSAGAMWKKLLRCNYWSNQSCCPVRSLGPQRGSFGVLALMEGVCSKGCRRRQGSSWILEVVLLLERASSLQQKPCSPPRRQRQEALACSWLMERMWTCRA